jgi:hypothetical protein
MVRWQICHWLTAVGLGEYVQVFRGMFVKLGITGKKSVVSLYLLVRERMGEGGEGVGLFYDVCSS